MKINILISILIIATSILSAQTDYYMAENGLVLTKIEVDIQKQEILTKFSKNNPEAIIALKILDKDIKGDSIINKYSYHVNLTPNKTKKEKIGLDKFIDKGLPERSFVDMKGKEYKIADFNGKPTLLNFWFAKCKPCIDEMPELNKLKEYFGERVNFVAITFESPEIVEKFLKKKDFDFVQIVNVQDYLDILGMKTYPKNVILDKDGTVISIESGIAYIQGDDGELQIGEPTALKNKLIKLLK